MEFLYSTIGSCPSTMLSDLVYHAGHLVFTLVAIAMMHWLLKRLLETLEVPGGRDWTFRLILLAAGYLLLAHVGVVLTFGSTYALHSIQACTHFG